MLLLLLVSAGLACNGVAKDAARLVRPNASNPSRCAHGGGAALHAVVFSAWVREFKKKSPKSCIDYNAIGSLGALKLLSTERSDFAVHELPLAEMGQAVSGGIKSIHIGVVAVAPIYNLSDVPNLKLSKKTLISIFSGKVTKWNDEAIRADNPGVNLPPIDILLYHDLPSAQFRGENSTALFMRYLSGAARAQGVDLPVDQWLVESRRYKGGEVVGFVRTNPGALSYVWVHPSPRGFRYAAVENDFGELIDPTVGSISEATRGYSVVEGKSKELAFEPVRGAYPIIAPMTIYYANSEQTSLEVVTFARWVLADGQSIAEEIGVAPLSDEFIRWEVDRIGEKGM